MTIDEQIEVMQAFNTGKQIQLRSLKPTIVGDLQWTDCGIHLNFNFSYYEYRVKPREPRRFWVNRYAEKKMRSKPAYDSREIADEQAMSDRLECIEVVEVIK